VQNTGVLFQLELYVRVLMTSFSLVVTAFHSDVYFIFSVERGSMLLRSSGWPLSCPDSIKNIEVNLFISPKDLLGTTMFAHELLLCENYHVG
jgi:hypothetical protein